MAFHYQRNDQGRRVVVTFQGPFEMEDARAILDRHRKEDVAGYGVLYDLRGSSGIPTNEELQLSMHEESSVVAAQEARGPIALVATDPVIYRKACLYAALGRPMLTIEVFRERGDAELWLETRSK